MNLNHLFDLKLLEKSLGFDGPEISSSAPSNLNISGRKTDFALTAPTTNSLLYHMHALQAYDHHIQEFYGCIKVDY